MLRKAEEVLDAKPDRPDFEAMRKDSSGSCQKEMKPQQDFSWVVKANDRPFHDRFSKRYAWCLKKKKYANNAIKTAKYNVFSFLPLNLFEQFHRLVNVYFLSVILLQTVPQISTLPWFALLFPLAILLGTRGIRDLIDDIVRHQSDWEFNNRPCEILIGKSFSPKKWRDIHVGDVVRICKDSFVPADLLLLSSSEPNSLCYVETMDIDGETNLKYRQALLVTHEQMTSEEAMSKFDGVVTCEEPNSQLNSFIGTLEWRGEKYALDGEKILLRGCRIRNTEICYGLVIYAGFDTKIMRNCGKVKMKKTKLIHLMDRLVLLITVVLLLLSFGLAVGSGLWAERFRQEHSYLYVFYKDLSSVEYAVYAFFGFIILFSLVIPMSMLITFEFIYLINSCFINWDVGMYYAPKDMPAKARSTSLNDQLGQIEYIFSDKTGTLTQNIMKFKKCCIGRKIYGSSHTAATSKLKEGTWDRSKCQDKETEFYDPALQRVVQQNDDPVVRDFMRLLALCHTVMVEEKENQLVYQAASPDEEALVSAARNLGYVFLSRTQDTITICELGVKRTYKVLALLDFNSVRKRMSVLVRDPEGRLKLYTKGADIVILERLQRGQETEGYTIKALDSFAEETLRTLCLAAKDISEEEYVSWSKKHYAASILLQDRASELDKVYEEIEKDLVLLGVTAIEDKLQEGVPETIALLKRGNIKVWVLTGDKQGACGGGVAKTLNLTTGRSAGQQAGTLAPPGVLGLQFPEAPTSTPADQGFWELKSKNIWSAKVGHHWETAVNIGFACQLLSDDMTILEEEDICEILEPSWHSSNNLSSSGESLFKSSFSTFLESPLEGKNALVVTGDFLDKIFHMGGEQAVKRKANHLSLLFGRPTAMDADPGLGDSVEKAFVELAATCQAVICCRVTPKQKALVVQMVKKHKRVISLAIGDGANDVNMIKTADIGVGISGQEGMQAVQCSDYAVAQFSFLQRLLFIHGRWAYLRICKFLRYFFFKTFASMMVQIWFAFYTGFTAQPLLESWFLALYNVFYTSLPVLCLGLFEQDVNTEKSLKFPELYEAGQKNRLFNFWTFCVAFVHGSLVSLCNFYITFWTIGSHVSTEVVGDYQSFGSVVATSAILIVIAEISMEYKYWNIFSVCSIVISFLFYCLFSYVTQSFEAYKYSSKDFAYPDATKNAMMDPTALLVVLLCVVANITPSLAVRFVNSVTMSKRLDVRDMHLKPRPVELTSHIKRRNTALRRSSYAFSHKGGYADLISKGASLKGKGPRHEPQKNSFSTTTTTTTSSLFKGSPELANVDPSTPETLPPLKIQCP